MRESRMYGVVRGALSNERPLYAIVVFIPKYRKKTIFGAIKKRLGAVFQIWRGVASAR